MRRRRLVFALAIAATPLVARAQQSHSQQTAWIKQHRVVIQVDQDDPKTMNLALNNAANMKEYWDKKGEKSQVEFVAFGPRSEEHTSELQSHVNLVCRLLLEKKK